MDPYSSLAGKPTGVAEKDYELIITQRARLSTADAKKETSREKFVRLSFFRRKLVKILLIFAIFAEDFLK